MIYVACPHAHRLSEVEDARVQIASEYSTHLLKRGHGVFCPLSYSAGLIDRNPNLANEVDWYSLDLVFLSIAKEVVVLMLDGFEGSKGVTLEVNYAKKLSLPVNFITQTGILNVGISQALIDKGCNRV